MKPRVAIVLPYFGSGGAENMVSRLVAHLDLSKIEAEVICIYGQATHNKLEDAVISHGVPIKFIGKGKGFSVLALYRLWKELSNFKATVVHTHLSACVYCAPWVVAHRIKMLHTIHNIPTYELIKPKQKVMYLMYKHGKAIPIAISDEIQSLTKKYYQLSENVELVYNPVDVEKYSIPHKQHDGIYIINVGRLSKAKNQRLLIDAIDKIVATGRNVKLIILGEGTLRNDLETYIKKQSLEKAINLMGNVNNAEEYYAQADIFALSSQYEGLPLVILEAMAAGLPIVSTDVGGIRDIVTDNGILVESGNKDMLVEALMRIIDDEALRIKMGEISRRDVVRFDSCVIANQYIELYCKYDRERYGKAK